MISGIKRHYSNYLLYFSHWKPYVWLLLQNKCLHVLSTFISSNNFIRKTIVFFSLVTSLSNVNFTFKLAYEQWHHYSSFFCNILYIFCTSPINFVESFILTYWQSIKNGNSWKRNTDHNSNIIYVIRALQNCAYSGVTLL